MNSFTTARCAFGLQHSRVFVRALSIVRHSVAQTMVTSAYEARGTSELSGPYSTNHLRRGGGPLRMMLRMSRAASQSRSLAGQVAKWRAQSSVKDPAFEQWAQKPVIGAHLRACVPHTVDPCACHLKIKYKIDGLK